MTMDDELRPLGRPEPDDELERRLEAYARARFAPDPARIARMRARLLAEVRERPAASPARLAPRSRRRTRWLPALLAAGLSVVLVGGAALAGNESQEVSGVADEPHDRASGATMLNPLPVRAEPIPLACEVLVQRRQGDVGEEW